MNDEWKWIEDEQPPKDRPFLACTTLACNFIYGNMHVCWWDNDVDRFCIGIANSCEYCGGISDDEYEFKILRWMNLPDERID